MDSVQENLFGFASTPFTRGECATPKAFKIKGRDRDAHPPCKHAGREFKTLKGFYRDRETLELLVAIWPDWIARHSSIICVKARCKTLSGFRLAYASIPVFDV